MKKALIFGINGQDGSYLAEFLLGNGYRVAGVVRRGSRLDNLDGVIGDVVIERMDEADPSSVGALLEKHRPDEVYNLAAQSHVGQSWDRLAETVQAGVILPVRIMEALHKAGGGGGFFQASTAALFGRPGEAVQTEATALYPRDPYGIAKYVPHRLAAAYRERFGYRFCSGILYNHESPRRPSSFVTRKITRAAARIKLGRESGVTLGSLDSVRDWGYAPDYVKGMWMMLQPERVDDYILATGKGRTVREFAETAFRLAGLDWREYVRVDGALARGDEGVLVGDPSRINRELGWYAETGFEEMVGIMIDADMRLETDAR